MYEQSLEMKEWLGNVQGLAATFTNMANLYKDQGGREKPERILEKALEIFERMDSPHAETARQLLLELEGGGER